MRFKVEHPYFPKLPNVQVVPGCCHPLSVARACISFWAKMTPLFNTRRALRGVDPGRLGGDRVRDGNFSLTYYKRAHMLIGPPISMQESRLWYPRCAFYNIYKYPSLVCPACYRWLGDHDEKAVALSLNRKTDRPYVIDVLFSNIIRWVADTKLEGRK